MYSERVPSWMLEACTARRIWETYRLNLGHSFRKEALRPFRTTRGRDRESAILQCQNARFSDTPTWDGVGKTRDGY